MKKVYALLLIAFNFIAFAQVISGKIVSSENHEALPYARIGIENENVGTISDEHGNFKMDFTNIDRNKIIKIEIGGYNPYKTSVNEFIKKNPISIELSPKVNDIEEVIINPKKYVLKNWGNNTKSKSVLVGHNSEHSEAKRSMEVAMLFNNRKKVKIEKINMNIARFNAKNPVFLRVNVYDKDFNSIITDDISAEITKNDLVHDSFSIDVKDFDIWVEGDFYVSLQILNDIEGSFYFSGAFLGNKTFFREYLGKWEKVPLASPAINIDVKVEK